MLGALKHYLKFVLVPLLYFGGIFVVFFTMFKEAKWGLLLLIFLIPQPNIWYKLHSYPFGKDFLDFLFFAIIIGIFFQKKGFEKSDNSMLIITFIIVNYLALWNSSLHFSLPLPVTTSNILLVEWKNYAQMIFLYFLSLNILKNEDDQKIAIILITIVMFIIVIRSYRNFSAGDVFQYDKRAGGPFETIQLGANHFGAFIAHFCSLFLGLFYFDKNKKRKCLYLATILIGLHPLFFSYSRGAYLAFLSSITLFGLIKKRSLLVAVATVLLAWQFILPPSVVNRIEMTQSAEGEIENSAAGRLELWQFAIDQFKDNPTFGIGFGGYALSVGGLTTSSGETISDGFDTHSYWMKVLSEQGIIGGSLFLIIVYRAFKSGLKLYIVAESGFYKGLGFGFMGCVLAVCITNIFGDRWSYFALGGYFWIIWGVIDRSILTLNKCRELKI